MLDEIGTGPRHTLDGIGAHAAVHLDVRRQSPLVAWADRCLGENLSIAVQIKEDHSLVTTGPYGRVRHPIYTAAIIVTASMLGISSNWIVGACFVVPIAILCAERIPREERLLIGRFGDEYRAYMKRTGRLLPWIVR